MTTIEEATKLLKMSDQTIWLKGLGKKRKEAEDMAIKSLEAWDIIKDNLSQQIHYNLDAKEKFEIGSTSRIECNTTASVLSGVIYLIDKHLSEVSE